MVLSVAIVCKSPRPFGRMYAPRPASPGYARGSSFAELGLCGARTVHEPTAARCSADVFVLAARHDLSGLESCDPQ